MTIYITRHGQIDPTPLCPNQHNPLSPLGRIQAEKLGNRLLTLCFSGTVYASPLHRCLETAEIICRVLKLYFRPEPRLGEIGLDSWIHDYVGLTVEQIKTLFPSCLPEATLPWPWWPKSSEAGGKVRFRIAPLIDQLLAEAVGDVLLVGHGATADAGYQYLTKEPIMHCNAALSAIQVQPSRMALLSADTAHLGVGEVTQNAEVVA